MYRQSPTLCLDASQRVRCTGMTIYKIPQPIASPHPRTKRASLDCSPFLRCLLELRGNLGFFSSWGLRSCYPRLAEGRFNPELPLTRELFRRLRQKFQPNASLCIFTNRGMGISARFRIYPPALTTVIRFAPLHLPDTLSPGRVI